MHICEHCGKNTLPTIKDLRELQISKGLNNNKLATLTQLDKGLVSRTMREITAPNVNYYFKLKKAIEEY